MACNCTKKSRASFEEGIPANGTTNFYSIFYHRKEAAQVSIGILLARFCISNSCLSMGLKTCLVHLSGITANENNPENNK